MAGELRVRTEVVARTGRLDPEDVKQLALELRQLSQASGESFGELAEAWLKRVGKRRVRPQNEQGHVRHLAALLELNESTLTVSRIEEHFAVLSDRLSNQTLNKVRSTGRLIIRGAQADGKWTRPNPFEVMKRLKEKRRLYLRMTLEELARTLACVRTDRRALARVAFFIGMRPGELLGLRKADVHLDGRYIDVHRSHQRDSTKTGKERRVPIPEAVVEDLRGAMAVSPSELVFPKPNGNPMRADTKLTRMFRAALVEAGVVTGYDFKCRRCGAQEHHADGNQRWCQCGAKLWASGVPRPFRFYDLRHLSATLHKEAGADAAVVKAVLGHAGDITEDIYTHFSEEYVKRQMNLLALPIGTGVQTVTVRNASTQSVASGAQQPAPEQQGPAQERRKGFEPSTPSLGTCSPDQRPAAWLKVKEVALQLRVTVDTVYHWIDVGRIRAVRIGSLIRVPSEELQRLPRAVRATSQHDEVRHAPGASSRYTEEN